MSFSVSESHKIFSTPDLMLYYIYTTLNQRNRYDISTIKTVKTTTQDIKKEEG